MTDAPQIPDPDESAIDELDTAVDVVAPDVAAGSVPADMIDDDAEDPFVR